MEKRRSTPGLGIAIYILLVIVTGIILGATSHFDNPITDIQVSLVSEESSKEAISGNPGMARSEEDQSKGGSPNEGHPDDENEGGSPVTGDRAQSHMEALSINWSQIGDVFFDVWFLAMVTALLIVIQQLFGFAKQLVQKRLNQD